MRELQHKLGMAIMFITHNLGVIAEMAEDVLVMYLGRVMEKADVDTIFYDPKHPYTQALLKSIPRLDKDEQDQQRLETIKGMVPSAAAIPRGCPFHPRCIKCIAGVCDVKTPPLVEVAPGHMVECHLYAK
jgi:peptide/nickel transport system ATP-binding protein